MNKTVKVCIAAGVVLGLAGVFIVTTLTLAEQETDVGWGRGRLKRSEAAYYLARIGRIGEYWRRTAEKAGCSRDGRIKAPYPTYLVIDTLKRAMWLETAGEVDPNNYTELPENMKWKLYRTSPDGNEELGPVVRLKIRGMWTKQILPEMVCVHSHGRDTGHLSFYIAEGQVNTDYGSGAFAIQRCKERRKEGVDYYDSIIVDDGEYADSIESAKGRGGEIAELKRAVDSELPRNMANWLEAEKQLNMEIERRAQEMGFGISNMYVTAGPDYTAGHAELRVRQDGALKDLLGRSSSGSVYLKIDYLGGDMWYLRSAVNPDRPPMPRMRGGKLPQFDFLVGGSGGLSEVEGQKWLQKGREIEEMGGVPEPAYSTTLPNGVTVEFFGICSNPSGGKQWWGPDGSLLEHSPYYNAETYGRGREDRQVYEMVWRISGARRTRHSMEGSQGSYYHRKQDRYGNDLRNLHPEGYGFDKDGRKTTWKVGVGTGDEDMQWVEFRNISLVPGRDFGFEIAEGEPF